MSEFLQATAELCFEIDKVVALPQLRGHLRTAADHLGADFFMFGLHDSGPGDHCVRVAVTNCSDTWRRYYDEQRAYEFDPVFREALKRAGPFRWDELEADARQAAFLEVAARHGLVHGISYAERAAHGEYCFLSFCGRSKPAADPATWSRAKTGLGLLTASARHAVERVSRSGKCVPGAAALTDTEVRSLELTARGKTASAVALELGVRPRTVRYYLDRAAEKLGVLSRREAVQKALFWGLITSHPGADSSFTMNLDRE